METQVPTFNTAEATPVQEMEQEQTQQSPVLTALQRFLKNKGTVVALCQHPGWQMFQQYLTELDEVLDIQGLMTPLGSKLGDDFRVKIAAQRLLIREFLHMSNDIITGRAFPKKEEGGN